LFSTLIGSLLAGFGNYRPDTFNKSAKNFGDPSGPNPGKRWQNYSPLGKNKHHCHLTYSYVACWEEVQGEIRLLEVYYVGSREDAPY
jgi:hypothetical protein